MALFLNSLQSNLDMPQEEICHVQGFIQDFVGRRDFYTEVCKSDGVQCMPIMGQFWNSDPLGLILTQSKGKKVHVVYCVYQ